MSFFKHLIVIPARYGSTRFPGKMLATIKGKTLIERTFENISRSQFTKNILIATDDERIQEHAMGFGANVVMTSKDCPNGTHRTYEAVRNHPQVSDETIVINVQGDEPMLNPACIKRLASALESDTSISMATLAAPFQSLREAKDASNVKCVFDKRGRALYFSRALIPYTTDYQKIYHHLGVYAFRKSFLEIYDKLSPSPLQQLEDLEQLKALENGYEIQVLIEKKPSFGIDLPRDLKKLEQCL